MPRQQRLLDLSSQDQLSFNDDEMSFKAVVATESMALRYNMELGYYHELLTLDQSVILDRVASEGAPLLWEHRDFIGRVQKAWIQNRQLYADLIFSKNAPLATQVYRDFKDGVLTKFSIGYTVGLLEDTGKRDASTGHPIMAAKKVRIFEVTATPMAQDNATGVRNLDNTEICEVIKLQERVMELENVQEVPKIQHSDAEIIARAIAETEERIEFLYRQKAKHDLSDDFISDLIKRKVTKGDCGVLILESLETRQNEHKPAPEQTRIEVTGDHRQKIIDFSTDALIAKNLPQANIKIANDNPYRNYTLMDIGRELLEDSGISTRGLPPVNLFKRLQGMDAFKALQANFAARTLQNGYQSVVRSWEPFIVRRPVRNFADILISRASRAPRLRKVIGGNVKQGSLAADEIETTKLASYSTWLALERQAIISDELGQFTEEIWAFGIMSGLLESQLIYAQLINNAVMSDGKTFFSADHGNVGTGETLDVDGLSTARKAIRSQKSSTNDPIQLDMSCIITGTSLQTKAEQLLYIGINPASVDQVNPFKGKYAIVSDSLLDDNPEIWIASTSKERNPIGILGYLDGQEGPYVETDTDITIDGTRFRYGIDVVAKLIDWRGCWVNGVPTNKVTDPADDVRGFVEEEAPSNAIRERKK
jgi:hypothetical protein